MPQLSTQATPTRSKPTAEGAYVDFMSRAYAMEKEAAERYMQFAEQLEVNGDAKCATLFRQLAEIEDRHAKHILLKMGWTSLPAPTDAFAWEGSESPETARLDLVNSLRHPHHALELALRHEFQAQKYFEHIASGGAPQRVRAAATEMATEERAHARLIENWLARVPRPTSGWE
jgi:rubrerythrin